jgi:transposase-like protein
MHGKRVGIYVDTRRYKCRACGKTFYERLPDADGKRAMTNRLVQWLGVQSIKRPFAHLAEEIGIHEVTVKNVFDDYVADLERTVKFETPNLFSQG